MREIGLTQGMVALVDDDDYERLAEHKWFAHRRPKFYAARRRPRGTGMIHMHREIMGNPPKGPEVDHIDGNGLNNQRSNLRLVTHSQNMANSRPYVSNTSGVPGVSWHKTKEKWQAYIQKNGRWIHLGYFDDFNDAAKARKDAALKYFGEFAWLKS